MFPFQTIHNEEFSDEFTNNYNTNEQCHLTLSDMKRLDAKNCYLQTTEFHDQYTNNNDFFLIHIHICNLNIENIEELLLGRKPDLIAISETKLKLNSILFSWI